MKTYIYVPTRSRVKRQTTREGFLLNYLPKDEFVVRYVINEHEKDDWTGYDVDLLLMPRDYRIGRIRQALLERHVAHPEERYQVWLDDDLRLYCTNDATFEKFLAMEPGPERKALIDEQYRRPRYGCRPAMLQDSIDFLRWCRQRMEEGFPQVSCAASDVRQYWSLALNDRTLCHPLHPEERIGARVQQIHGVDTKLIHDLGIYIGALNEWEDAHLGLSLFESGYENLITYRWTQQQNGSNKPGGCSVTRNLENYNEATQELARLHPRYVKPRPVRSKGSFWGGERLGASIEWEQAVRDCHERRRGKGV